MPPFKARWAEFAAALRATERWLLPGACLLCERRTFDAVSDPLICAPCRSRWARLPEPVCDRCGQPGDPSLSCRLCAEWPPGLTGVRSAVWLDAGARRAVHLLKYEGWRRVADAIVETLAPLARSLGPATLVPIPLGTARQRARGYNQSAELAVVLGDRLALPVAPDALQRRRETATQTALTPEARRANLRGAFVARHAPPAPVLIDDVFTTGATLASAASALLAAGATTVRGLTFARAPRQLAEAAAEADRTPRGWRRGRRG